MGKKLSAVNMIKKKHYKKILFQILWQSAAILSFAIILGFLANTLRANRLDLKTDRSTKSQLSQGNDEAGIIPFDLAKKNFYGHAAVFIDARSTDSYNKGHIKGALSLPLDYFEERYWKVMANVSSETLIITYCNGENCHASEEIAMFLFELGHNNVKILVNGWTLWQQNSLPVEKGPAASS